uniref:Endonuclease/exonuclease/phosphatase domain-containing protein n=1 Tax=Denticeps clupeoides TaxID=299321 RepID=A0AAY4D581_9TELE
MAGLNRSGLGSLRSVRWNIKGLHHPIKRCRIFSHLKALAPEIIFLQETHLRVNEHSKLKRGWVDHIFHSEFGDRSRGAAILIRKVVPFINESVISDTKGRFVIVIGKLCGFNEVLANVYGPNWDDPQFFYRSRLQNGKSPGPDGFPIEFYKVFSAKLTPLLNKLFEEILSQKKLPCTMTQAVIVVLLKKR